MTAEAVAPGWLLAALPGALVAVCGQVEVRLALDDVEVPSSHLARALAEGTDAAALAGLAGVPAADAAALLNTLRERGALVPAGARPAVPTTGMPLADAVVAVLGGGSVDAAWTAEELLVLPVGADADLARRAVRAFVSGLRPVGRLRAYAQVASTADRTSVHGDLPADARALGDAVRRARRSEPAAVHVVDLATGTRVAVPAALAGRLGFDRGHRLGPLLDVADAGRLPDATWAARALHAAPSLRHARSEAARTTHGIGGSAAEAELVARAEAAERHALGDPTAVELRRAPRAALDGAIAPAALHAHTARQRAALGLPEPRPDDALLWARATTLGGLQRWVPATLALMPFDDPSGPPLPAASSSGAAAHLTREEAIQRALLELIERDAFLWTWIQRVARERIDDASLPERGAALAAALRRAGGRVDLVNLTLDTAPVVLCVLRGASGLLVSVAAREDAGHAATRALAEAALLAASLTGRPPRPPAPELVRTPLDHVDLHRGDGDGDAAFLTASPDVIDVREIAPAPAALESALAVVGEPLVVDFAAAATAPFRVVRVLVPGLVPMTFGWDTEALGTPRLGAPILTADGRRLGRRLDLEALGPLRPHPFG